MWRIVTFGMHLTSTMLRPTEQMCHIKHDNIPTKLYMVNFEFGGSKS